MIAKKTQGSRFTGGRPPNTDRGRITVEVVLRPVAMISKSLFRELLVRGWLDEEGELTVEGMRNIDFVQRN